MMRFCRCAYQMNHFQKLPTMKPKKKKKQNKTYNDDEVEVQLNRQLYTCKILL